MTAQSAWQAYAPRGVWAFTTQRPVQNIFIVELEQSGLDNYELPASTILIRSRNIKASYIRCTVPDPLRHTEAVLARAEGIMRIYAGYKMQDGTRQVDPILYGNIDGILFDQGSTDILQITANRYATYSSPQAVALQGVYNITRSAQGRIRCRCPFGLFIRPGDIATALGESFEVDLIICSLLADDAQMEVEGVAIG